MTRLSRLILLGAAAAGVWAVIAVPQSATPFAPLAALGASVAALVVLGYGKRFLGLEQKDIASLSMLAWTMAACAGAFVAVMPWMIESVDGSGPSSALSAILDVRDRVLHIETFLSDYGVMFWLLAGALISGGLLLAAGNAPAFDILTAARRKAGNAASRLAALALCLGSFSVATGTVGTWGTQALDVRLDGIESARRQDIATLSHDLVVVMLDDAARAVTAQPDTNESLDQKLDSLYAPMNEVQELKGKLGWFDDGERYGLPPGAPTDPPAWTHADELGAKVADMTNRIAATPGAYVPVSISAFDDVPRETLMVMRQSASEAAAARTEGSSRLQTLARMTLELALAGVDIPTEFDVPELGHFFSKLASAGVVDPLKHALEDRLAGAASDLISACTDAASCRPHVDALAETMHDGAEERAAQSVVRHEANALANEITARESQLGATRTDMTNLVTEKDQPPLPDPPSPPPPDPTPPDDEMVECTCQDQRTGAIVWTRAMSKSQCQAGTSC